jgi:nitroreductase
MNMEFKELVTKARTYRRYHQNKLVPMELLMEIIDMARLIPSRANAQPLRYAVSTSPEMNVRLFPLVQWAPALDDWPGPPEGQRPVAFIVIGVDTKSPQPPEMDAGIAAQTIQLALAENGIGCCIFSQMDAVAVHAAVGFPRYVAAQLTIAIGYPNETVIIEELRKGQPYFYRRDEQGQHYVPKRKLDDILLAKFE